MLLTAKLDGLPIVNFAVGGIATPVDAALIMWLDADGVFVGSSIFKSGYPEACLQVWEAVISLLTLLMLYRRVS